MMGFIIDLIIALSVFGIGSILLDRVLKPNRKWMWVACATLSAIFVYITFFLLPFNKDIEIHSANWGLFGLAMYTFQTAKRDGDKNS